MQIGIDSLCRIHVDDIIWMEGDAAAPSRRQRLNGTTALTGCLRALPVIALTTSLLMAPADRAGALPQGGDVVGGAATIEQVDPSTLNITHGAGSPAVAIEWQSFDVAGGEVVNFFHHSIDSATLNTVIGGLESLINGNINTILIGSNGATGGTFALVNPSGITFGPGANVNVGSIIASSIGIEQGDFMAGNYEFGVKGQASARILNEGAINVADGGLVALVAPGVENTGVINARLGKVSLASGNKFTLDFYGDGLVLLAVDDAVSVAANGPGRALVEQSGQIIADGGIVQLSAAAAKNVVDTAINMTGVVRAQSVGQLANGQIILTGGDHGIVNVAGTLDASGLEGGQTGGHISMVGEAVTMTGDALLDVSGAAGGGTAYVGISVPRAHPAFASGPTRATAQELKEDPGTLTADITSVGADTSILANATVNGDGGDVVVWADEYLEFLGLASAQGGPNGGAGGFIEVSTAGGGFIDAILIAGAVNGENGQVLIDPTDACVATAIANCTNTTVALVTTPATVTASLNAGTDFTLATSGAGGDDGDIEVADPIASTTPSLTTLRFEAHDDIFIDATDSITDTGAGLNVELIAGAFGDPAGEERVRVDAPITTNGGHIIVKSEFFELDDNNDFMTTSGGNVDIEANNVDIATGVAGLINAGTGTITITRESSGRIGLGGPTGNIDDPLNPGSNFADMDISQAELAAMSAATLVIGDPVQANNNTIDIFVEDADSTTATIAGLVQLNALGVAGADVEFQGTNLFEALEANARDSIRTHAGSITTSNSTLDFITPTKIFILGSLTGQDVFLDAPTIDLDADIVLTASSLGGTGNTVNVLSNSAEIQDGIDVAAVNGTVNVAADTYDENVVIDKDGVQLLGAGKNVTTIRSDDGTAEATVLIRKAGGGDIANVKVDGFTINADDPNGDDTDFGVLGDDVRGLTVSNNQFKNGTEAGVRVFLDNTANPGSAAKINRINDNMFDTDGGGNPDAVRDAIQVRGNPGNGNRIVSGGLEIARNMAGTGHNDDLLDEGINVLDEVAAGSVLKISENTIFANSPAVEFNGPITGGSIRIGDGNSLHSGDSAIYFFEAVSAGLIQILNNPSIVGKDNGIEFAAISGGTILIQGNNHGIHANEHGMFFGGNISGSADIDIHDNIIEANLNNDHIGSGIFFNGTIGGTATINIGDGFGDAGPDGNPSNIISVGDNTSNGNGVSGLDGIHFDKQVGSQAQIVIDGNRLGFTTASPLTVEKLPDDGIEFKGPVKGRADIKITDNFIEAKDDGVQFTGPVSERAKILVGGDLTGPDGNTINAHDDGVSFLSTVSAAAHIEISFNDIVAKSDGILFAQSVTGATVKILNNNAGIFAGDHGINFGGNVGGGADIDINGNIIKANLNEDHIGSGIWFGGQISDAEIQIGEGPGPYYSGFPSNIISVETNTTNGLGVSGLDGIHFDAAIGLDAVIKIDGNAIGFMKKYGRWGPYLDPSKIADDGIEFKGPVGRNALIKMTDNKIKAHDDGIQFTSRVGGAARVLIGGYHDGNYIDAWDDGISFFDVVTDQAQIDIAHNWIYGGDDGIEFKKLVKDGAQVYIGGNPLIKGLLGDGIVFNGVSGYGTYVHIGYNVFIYGGKNGIRFNGAEKYELSDAEAFLGGLLGFEFVDPAIDDGAKVKIDYNKAIYGASQDGIQIIGIEGGEGNNVPVSLSSYGGGGYGYDPYTLEIVGNGVIHGYDNGIAIKRVFEVEAGGLFPFFFEAELSAWAIEDARVKIAHNYLIQGDYGNGILVEGITADPSGSYGRRPCPTVCQASASSGYNGNGNKHDDPYAYSTRGYDLLIADNHKIIGGKNGIKIAHGFDIELSVVPNIGVFNVSPSFVEDPDLLATLTAEVWAIDGASVAIVDNGLIQGKYENGIWVKGVKGGDPAERRWQAGGMSAAGGWQHGGGGSKDPRYNLLIADNDKIIGHNGYYGRWKAGDNGIRISKGFDLELDATIEFGELAAEGLNIASLFDDFSGLSIDIEGSLNAWAIYGGKVGIIDNDYIFGAGGQGILVEGVSNREIETENDNWVQLGQQNGPRYDRPQIQVGELTIAKNDYITGHENGIKISRGFEVEFTAHIGIGFPHLLAASESFDSLDSLDSLGGLGISFDFDVESFETVAINAGKVLIDWNHYITGWHENGIYVGGVWGGPGHKDPNLDIIGNHWISGYKNGILLDSIPHHLNKLERLVGHFTGLDFADPAVDRGAEVKIRKNGSIIGWTDDGIQIRGVRGGGHDSDMMMMASGWRPYRRGRETSVDIAYNGWIWGYDNGISVRRVADLDFYHTYSPYGFVVDLSAWAIDNASVKIHHNWDIIGHKENGILVEGIRRDSHVPNGLSVAGGSWGGWGDDKDWGDDKGWGDDKDGKGWGDDKKGKGKHKKPVWDLDIHGNHLIKGKEDGIKLARGLDAHLEISEGQVKLASSDGGGGFDLWADLSAWAIDNAHVRINHNKKIIGQYGEGIFVGGVRADSAKAINGYASKDSKRHHRPQLNLDISGNHLIKGGKNGIKIGRGIDASVHLYVDLGKEPPIRSKDMMYGLMNQGMDEWMSQSGLSLDAWAGLDLWAIDHAKVRIKKNWKIIGERQNGIFVGGVRDGDQLLPAMAANGYGGHHHGHLNLDIDRNGWIQGRKNGVKLARGLSLDAHLILGHENKNNHLSLTDSKNGEVENGLWADLDAWAIDRGHVRIANNRDIVGWHENGIYVGGVRGGFPVKHKDKRPDEPVEKMAMMPAHRGGWNLDIDDNGWIIGGWNGIKIDHGLSAKLHVTEARTTEEGNFATTSLNTIGPIPLPPLKVKARADLWAIDHGYVRIADNTKIAGKYLDGIQVNGIRGDGSPHMAPMPPNGEETPLTMDSAWMKTKPDYNLLITGNTDIHGYGRDGIRIDEGHTIKVHGYLPALPDIHLLHDEGNFHRWIRAGKFEIHKKSASVHGGKVLIDLNGTALLDGTDYLGERIVTLPSFEIVGKIKGKDDGIDFVGHVGKGSTVKIKRNMIADSKYGNGIEFSTIGEAPRRVVEVTGEDSGKYKKEPKLTMVKVHNNFIDGNGMRGRGRGWGSGVKFGGDIYGRTEVFQNYITRNGFAGVKIGYGVKVGEDPDNPDSDSYLRVQQNFLPGPVDTEFGNKTWALYHGGYGVVDARGNWWGSTDLSTVEDSISGEGMEGMMDSDVIFAPYLASGDEDNTEPLFDPLTGQRLGFPGWPKFAFQGGPLFTPGGELPPILFTLLNAIGNDEDDPVIFDEPLTPIQAALQNEGTSGPRPRHAPTYFTPVYETGYALVEAAAEIEPAAGGGGPGDYWQALAGILGPDTAQQLATLLASMNAAQQAALTAFLNGLSDLFSPTTIQTMIDALVGGQGAQFAEVPGANGSGGTTSGPVQLADSSGGGGAAATPATPAALSAADRAAVEKKLDELIPSLGAERVALLKQAILSDAALATIAPAAGPGAAAGGVTPDACAVGGNFWDECL